MLKFGNKEFRNLQEQVLKNMQNIANIKEGTAVLSEFGIKVVGEVDTLADLPSVADYKAAHEDWEYGDAFAVGTAAPYSLYILTRENDTVTADHWFDIGDFPAPGPQGAQGPQGEVGPQGQQGNQGEPGVDAGFGSILAAAQTLPAGSQATATVTASGPNTAKEFSFTFGIPRGADGGQASWGNIKGTLSDQTDLDNALDAKQDTLVSGTNIKTINNQSVVGSGNIEINSGVWGNITGTLSDQTDLANALAEKQPVIDASHKLSASYVSGLADVATTGAYSDLSGKPTIGEGTITIKKNNETIDSFTLNQTASQNINIVVPTKTSDLSNDSNFTSKTYVDDGLALKQDVISDLSAIRSGAALGATALQSIPSEYITDSELATELATKQDVISDLSDIRSGAAAGATAVQPAALESALDAKVDKEVVIDEVEGESPQIIGHFDNTGDNVGIGVNYGEGGNVDDSYTTISAGTDTVQLEASRYGEDEQQQSALTTSSIEMAPDYITLSSPQITLSTNDSRAPITISRPDGKGSNEEYDLFNVSLYANAYNDNANKLVTTDTAQTITGAKTFINSNGIKIKASSNDQTFAIIQREGNTGLTIKPNGILAFEVATGGNSNKYLMNATGFYTQYNNEKNLGTTSHFWKDLYLAGNLTDGTNSISIANIASKSEIPSNYVTTDTNQTITGQKTFKNNNGLIISNTNNNNGKIYIDSNGIQLYPNTNINACLNVMKDGINTLAVTGRYFDGLNYKTVNLGRPYAGYNNMWDNVYTVNIGNQNGTVTTESIRTLVNSAANIVYKSDLTNMVNTDEAQTISGYKTFTNSHGIKLENSNNGDINTATLSLGKLESGLKCLFINARDGIGSTGYNGSLGILPEQETTNGGLTLLPVTTGTVKDIGRQSMPWRDIWISGSIYDPNVGSASAADIIALVNYAKRQGWIQ